VPTYRLIDADGNDAGEVRLPDPPVKAGEEIFLRPGKTLRVLSVGEADDHDPRYASFLTVEEVT
jgi:hypothetical protein